MAKHKRRASRPKSYKRPEPAATNGDCGTTATPHEVDRIVTSRVDESGTELFRLRWKGCEAAEDSWRTREQLGDGDDCKALLASFLADVHKKVGFKETATLKRVNAAGNSIVEEVVLKG